jgi:hypothetical protein
VASLTSAIWACPSDQSLRPKTLAGISLSDEGSRPIQLSGVLIRHFFPGCLNLIHAKTLQAGQLFQPPNDRVDVNLTGRQLFEDVEWDADKRCLYASPGLGCGKLPEMIALAIVFWLSALVSGFFVIFTIRKSKVSRSCQDQFVLFWIFLMIWQLYHSVITFFDFAWDS